MSTSNNNGTKNTPRSDIQTGESSSLRKSQSHPQQSINKDSEILVRFRTRYQKTGNCDSLPILVEIVHLVRKGNCVLPREAKKLAANLDRIAEVVYEQVSSLTHQLDEIEHNNLELLIDLSIALSQRLVSLIEPLEQLLDISRNFPDPPTPGEKEGTFLCLIPTEKLFNDLYYSLGYVKEHSRRDRFAIEVERQTDSSFYIRRLTSLLGDIRLAVGQLIERLRGNIARCVPSLAQQ